MSLPSAVLDAMLASGCTAEQIVAAVKAAGADADARREAKRSGNAERQRRFKAKGKVTPDNADNALPAVTPPPPAPLDKETSPRPPKEINPPEPPPPGDCSAPAEPILLPEHIVEKWNEIAPAIGKPPIRKLTPERREAVKARIHQNDIDDFVTVFGNIRGSPFLQEWRGMGFDWVMKKANFQKVLEGNYNG